MTAPLLTSSFDSSTVEPVFSYRPRLPIASRTQRSSNRSSVQASVDRYRDRLNFHESQHSTEVTQLWEQLLEMVPQGIVVFSRNLKPVYYNQNAKKLCQVLAGGELVEGGLPLAVSEACYGVMRDSQALHSSLVVECRTSTGHLVRVSARLLELSGGNEVTAPLRAFATQSNSVKPSGWIVVFLENCNDLMQQEAKIQQQKYDLTDREAEIWMLLRQELTYQEIAQSLQISLNTVKTHVKNVYAKRRNGEGKEKFWC